MNIHREWQRLPLLLFAIIFLWIPLKETNALAGISEYTSWHHYTYGYLLDWGRPSDSCPIKPQDCVLVTDLNKRFLENLGPLDQINVPEKDKKLQFIFGQSHIDKDWLIYDLNTKEIVYRDDNLEAILAKWNELGNPKPVLVDRYNVDKFFLETAQSIEEGKNAERLLLMLFFLGVSFIFFEYLAIPIIILLGISVRLWIANFNNQKKIHVVQLFAGFVLLLSIFSLEVGYQVIYKVFFPNLFFLEKPVDTKQLLSRIGFEIRGLSDNWYRYTHYDFGFLIDVPATSYEYVSNGKKLIGVPVKVIPDNDGVFITKAWTMDSEGNRLKDITLFDLKAEKFPAWKITITNNIYTREDLLSFIKSRYYIGCDIEEIKSTGINNVHDVKLKRTAPDAPPSEYCFVNWATIIKYSPKEKKIASLDLGQDANFVSEVAYPYDNRMVESFLFIDR